MPQLTAQPPNFCNRDVRTSNDKGVQVDGHTVDIALHQALDGLVEYCQDTKSEHSNWYAYCHTMLGQDKMLIQLQIER